MMPIRDFRRLSPCLSIMAVVAFGLAGCSTSSGPATATPPGTVQTAPTIGTVTAAQVVPTTTFALDVKGTGFVAGSTVNVDGFSTTGNTFVSSTEVTANVSVAYGTTSITVSVTTPNPAATTPTKVVSILVTADAATAGRLLDQATFGPTAADIAHVQAVGVDAWITEQFAQPSSTIAQIDPNSAPASCVITNPYTCVMTRGGRTC